MLLLKKGDYMPPCLGFAWGQKYYMFTVLPFWLCMACYLFINVVRPLVRYWRVQGLRVVLYVGRWPRCSIGPRGSMCK